MPRKPALETCQEKGGQYIHQPKRNGVAGRSMWARSAFRNLESLNRHNPPCERQMKHRRSKLYTYAGISGFCSRLWWSRAAHWLVWSPRFRGRCAGILEGRWCECLIRFRMVRVLLRRGSPAW